MYAIHWLSDFRDQKDFGRIPDNPYILIGYIKDQGERSRVKLSRNLPKSHIVGQPRATFCICAHDVDRIWGIWGSYYKVPNDIFHLLTGDYTHVYLIEPSVDSQRLVINSCPNIFQFQFIYTSLNMTSPAHPLMSDTPEKSPILAPNGVSISFSISSPKGFSSATLVPKCPYSPSIFLYIP